MSENKYSQLNHNELLKGVKIDKEKLAEIVSKKTTNPLALKTVGKSITNEMLNEMITLQKEKEHRTEQYNQSVLRTLEKIEQNTGNLYQIVQLLNTQTDKQDTIIELLTEVLAISTSATKEEAEGKYRSVMKKITTVTEDVETIQKLSGFAQMVFQMFQSLG
ncbi:hypothetical protein CQ058_21530 [Bacillus sp. MYb56]|uniref:hypothetical protein n=1 Tax=Bacillus TaxID=1386 RepID=UPI000279953A|nr:MULTISPECIES: hypothetical protein [Bacillus]EJS11220.1 hypothetical protein IKO_00028 [Bacillus cereus VDM034]PRD08155.1 hypothetical protein CQ058_21530 [Bacillus sp. MYb56]QWI20349.1 hypothetical protein EXW34_02905 [Bacillus mycoides]